MELKNDLIDEILDFHRIELGSHFESYRNHVYRVFNLTLILLGNSGADTISLAVAAAFHDIGIWTNHTLDYLDPSVVLANSFLTTKQLEGKDVEAIIAYHHKLTPYKGSSIVEAFRKADLIDLSTGLIRFSVKPHQYKKLTKMFPHKGFHKFIFKLIFINFIKHPRNPLPIVKF